MLQGFLQSWGYVAIIVFGVLESACVPISSELTFLLGGALASAGFSATHHLNLALVIILGTLAELAGSYIAYAVGRAGGHPLVRRWGRYVLVTESDVARAERFLVGRGVWAVPVARMLPLVRAFAGLVSGIVDIPPLRFGVLNLIGTLIYVTALSSVGYSLGHEYSKINRDLSAASYVIVAIVVIAIAGFVIIRLREFRKEAAARDGDGGNGQGDGGQHRRQSSERLGR
ncbi:MAG: DedA family protein [Nocardiopsaceae bacterium]|nr:DedA family protein [Nocardiopsaceae bacterium]